MKMKKFMAVLAAAAMLSAVPVTGCGSTIDPSKSAATLDGKEIQMGVANFMAQFQAAQTFIFCLIMARICGTLILETGLQ